MVRTWRVVLVAAACAIAGLAQRPQGGPPAFANYAVRTARLELSMRSPVQLRTAFDRTFRTRLKAASIADPNFAGKYHLALWGCGSGCATGALVDLALGAVHRLPLDSDAYPEIRAKGWLEGCNMLGPKIDFKLDSRLLIVQCDNQTSGAKVVDTHYFVWNDQRFEGVWRVTNDPKPPIGE